MTPFELVQSRYQPPPHIDPFPQQIQVINDRVGQTNGEWLDMGCGKTFCSTWVALYHLITIGARTVIIMPPILLMQWYRWLLSINPAPTVTLYQGTPKERKALSLNAEFVLVGVQIFKRDYNRFREFYRNVDPLVVIVDEATMVANVESGSHETVYDFSVGRICHLLTGTPANKPMDAYGLIKFTAPGTYRNKRHFENTHVADRDYFGNPCEWQQLDLLYENLQKNASRVLLEDMYPGTEAPLFVPQRYSLDPDHMRLYRRLAEEQLLLLPDGGKIDATTVQRLRHALGQIIVNHDHFSGDPKAKSTAVDLVANELEALGEAKLVVFADYRMTVQKLVKEFQHVGARAINSQVPEGQKQRNLEAFIGDPACRLLIVQFVSGGKGLDGLQHVCNHCLFIEPCQQPRDFHQAVARLKRLGQRKRVVAKLAIADGTLQVRGFRSLITNDDTVNKVVRNAYDLRSMIFGE